MENWAETASAESHLVSLSMWEGETSRACSRLGRRVDGGRSMSGRPCDSRLSLKSMKLKMSAFRRGLLFVLGIRFPASRHSTTQTQNHVRCYKTLHISECQAQTGQFCAHGSM